MTRGRFQFRLWTVFLLTAVVAVLFGVIAIRREADPGRKIRYWEGRLVGQSRAAVVSKFGLPKDEFDGHYGLPDASFVKLHPTAKTLIFPQSGGKLYISFERKGAKWIAFACSYVPDGSVID
ncbi:MAG TPA: hypothetical protein VHB99_00520 [Pirellulales bacterium]|nr:hypothetical protein [Pirellulales bacterium]